MAVSVAVCEIFSVKEWCDLENMAHLCRCLVDEIQVKILEAEGN